MKEEVIDAERVRELLTGVTEELKRYANIGLVYLSVNLEDGETTNVYQAYRRKEDGKTI